MALVVAEEHFGPAILRAPDPVFSAPKHEPRLEPYRGISPGLVAAVNVPATGSQPVSPARPPAVNQRSGPLTVHRTLRPPRERIRSPQAPAAGPAPAHGLSDATGETSPSGPARRNPANTRPKANGPQSVGTEGRC